MVDNQHQKISGYRDLTEKEIGIINEVKRYEEQLGLLWREADETVGVDKRWMRIAKTHFEEGFMAFVRSIARPVERF